MLDFLETHYLSTPQSVRSDVRILEVGCGSGGNLWAIAKEGFDVHGLDFSSEAISLCRDALKEWGVTATLSVADMTETNYPDQYFDCLLDVFSAYALPQEMYLKFLKEATRICKPGGRLFYREPSTESDAFHNPGNVERIDEYTFSGIERSGAPYSGNNYPFRFTDPAKISGDLESSGFHSVEVNSTTRTYRDRQELFRFVVASAVKAG